MAELLQTRRTRYRRERVSWGTVRLYRLLVIALALGLLVAGLWGMAR